MCIRDSYGLERKKIGHDEWEKVDIRHSWNAPHRISNYILLKLQRHSDHHENAYKPYQILCSYEQSPQLPSGYTVMILLSFVPKVWFKVMNPRALSYKKYEKIIPEEDVASQEECKKFIRTLSALIVPIVLLGYIY
eukprot:TRINITY_DN1129_c0_g1_i4.p1 TRINITY_DN1129_c0_g1~~TRINITY_DN1129_c0_g1_i4.p1  ORF type:complete len:136 (-),score=28.47 TRINITY_DN1129_c0_g1_i4:214-621(-)